MVLNSSNNKDLAFFAALEEHQVFNELASGPKGLSSEEALQRLFKYGPNTLSEHKKVSMFFEFLSHFKSPLIIILLVAAIVSFIFGEIIDSIIIAVMILLSVVLDFVIEHSAQNAAEKLKESIKVNATVIRNGEKKEIGISDLVPGDLILLSAGDLVPADVRILEAKDFFINQSALTGESFPCEKKAVKLLPEVMALTELENMAFLGTSVVTGSAKAIVVKTGMNTEFGKISKSLVSSAPASEFDMGIKNFGYLIMKATFFLVLFIFIFNSLSKNNFLQSFMFAIAVAVGLTPELLPMVMSVSMGIGSLRMAKKGAIVKKLSSIPNFGSIDVLCTDKTGTLTEDKIKLVKCTDIERVNSESVLTYAYLNSYFETGIKNPLDEAVLNYKKVFIAGYSKIDEIPFDFSRRKMSVVVEKEGKRILITKGAPEEIFKNCIYYQHNGKIKSFDKKAIDKIRQQYHDLSSEGYRVLAIAIKEVDNHIHTYSKDDEIDLIFCGLVSFFDPPKDYVKEVLKDLKEMGIEVKVLTGDNELVTKKICNEIGLDVKGILLGSEIDELSEEALRVRVEKTTVFARFSPEQKDRVILALKANNHVVGYLGDGINDAPSLKTADIGISVNSAVDIAKESADIVLTKKSLKELRDGVIEGRKNFANTLKYIMMGLSSNFGNMFSLTVAVILLPFLPMLPLQILLNNFIYDLSQITIPTDNIDKNLIEKPKRWNMKFIKRFMVYLGPISSIFDLVTFGMLFFVLKVPEAAFQTGWFLESLATQTLVIHIIRTKKTPFIQSRASKYLLISSICAVAFGWILPYTSLGEFFKFVRLPVSTLLILAGIVIVYLVCVEIGKRIFYKHFDI